MDPLENPFSPGAGSPPPELAGRGELLEQVRITLGRIKVGRSEQSFILVGLRGVGKTVLLTRIRQMAEADGYEVATIEVSENRPLPAVLIPELRKILFRFDAAKNASDKVKRALRVLRSFVGGLKVKVQEIEFGLDIDPEKGSADSGNLEADLAELFVALGEAAQEKGAAVCLTIDEIQYLSEEEMSALIMAMHRVSQRQLPTLLAGAGLPQVLALAGRAKSYAERLFSYPRVGELLPEDAKNALREPVARRGVAFTEGALDELFAVTRGYPYFIQQWGYQAWGLATRSPIDAEIISAATAEAIKKLDESFFRVRFDRLTPREKDYMRAMAELGDGAHRSGDIADCLGVRVQSVAPLRSGLIRKGMIYSPAHGDTAFTVPLFNEFMLRTVPKFQPKRRRRPEVVDVGPKSDEEEGDRNES